MAPRRITSLTALLTFIALSFTSIFTYLAPRGPGSSDWTGLWLSKHKWLALHTDIGLIFFLACLVHIFYNLKPIAAYLKNQLGRKKVFNANFNVALIITLWVIISSLFSLPPFNAIQSFKQNRDNRGQNHAKVVQKDVTEEAPKVATKEEEKKKEPLPAKPPLFYSGRSMKRLSGKYEMDIGKIIRGLKDIGIVAKSEWTFNEIARQNDMNAESVYAAVLQVQ